LAVLSLAGSVLARLSRTTCLELNLCSVEVALSCLNKVRKSLTASDYRCHPWAEKAKSAGYHVFLSADELAKLKPHQGKMKQGGDPKT